MTDRLLTLIREGKPLTTGQQLRLAALLSLPAIVLQLSSIIMQYIDAAMVGHLGAEASASIGLVSTTTWLFAGTCSSAAMGFSVQVAHAIGGKDFQRARRVLAQGLLLMTAFSLFLALAGALVSPWLPGLLGGSEEICKSSSTYFLVFSLSLPFLMLGILTGGMLRCSGNMKLPSQVGVAMCVMDVVFNFLLIFPTRTLYIIGIPLTVPGAGLGVLGAALGTAGAEVVASLVMLYYLLCREPLLRLPRSAGHFRPTRQVVLSAVKIATPMGFEHFAICGAQIVTTIIVAPLGVVAIAANAFAVTAESLCYMPGYGIADAATTLVGQCLGAGRRRLMCRFAWLTVLGGIGVMGVMGVLLWLAAPTLFSLLSPVEAICSLGTEVLRIEAWAEPMFGASIVAYGVYVGAGRTLPAAFMNFGSIWLLRITLAALLAPSLGLRGVWIAMCGELCLRGLIFLLGLGHMSKSWRKP